MNFVQFNKLSFWNKVGAVGSVASIIGLLLFFLDSDSKAQNANTQQNSNGSTLINNNGSPGIEVIDK